ncbi:hypothetical protein D9M73_137000 [compost metagenome]
MRAKERRGLRSPADALPVLSSAFWCIALSNLFVTACLSAVATIDPNFSQTIAKNYCNRLRSDYEHPSSRNTADTRRGYHEACNAFARRYGFGVSAAGRTRAEFRASAGSGRRARGQGRCCRYHCDRHRSARAPFDDQHLHQRGRLSGNRQARANGQRRPVAQHSGPARGIFRRRKQRQHRGPRFAGGKRWRQVRPVSGRRPAGAGFRRYRLRDRRHLRPPRL